jgi:hypothetical protein
MLSTHRLLLLLPLCLVLAVGCKGSKNPSSQVSGKVTYKGQPVSAGTVTFNLKEGGNYGASLKADGSYTVTGLPAQEMIVTVETESANPKQPKATYGPPMQKKGQEDPTNMYSKMMKQKGFGADAAPESGAYVPIPMKYADKEQSPLRINLTRGENKKDFDLTD